MAGTGQKPAILIVDDEERLRNALARSFRQAGYQIRVAACGEEALAVLAAEPVELVITDLVMPGMDGLALVRALQTGASPPKVLILTAYGTAESQAEAQGLGVAGYLTKPFDLAQLKSRVHQLLRGSAAGGRGGGWAVRSGYVICVAAGQALGVLAGLPRKVWSCVQPGQVVFTTGKAIGAVSQVCRGVRRRIVETR
jgi:DNA-binding response OmpR family regulator